MRLFRLLRSINNGGATTGSSSVATTTVAQQEHPNMIRKLFGKYLLLTNTLSAGLLMVAGDLAAQEYERRGNRKNKDQQLVQIVDRYDWTRVGQMFIVGALSGPPHHVFYKWLDKLIPKATTTAVIKKIGLDQLIFSPICIFVFFYGAGLVEGHRLQDCHEELRQKFWTVYKTDWTVWPAAQFINFYFLPPHYRVLYVNVVTTLYNVFLSHIKHQDMSSSDAKEKK